MQLNRQHFRNMWIGTMLGLAPLPSAGVQAEDSPKASGGVHRGSVLFLQCRACHTVGVGEASGVGPNLRSAFGARAGARPGYSYSDALKASGLVWTRANLDAFLTRPTEKVPGTKMAFQGVADAKQRAALIDYLASLSAKS